MKVRVDITLKPGVLDPQGEAVRHALGALGFDGVQGVRQGKVIELDLATEDADLAKSQAAQMAEKLLSNQVIENFTVTVI